jgi:glucose-6-phosphate-specific signal transduction histidine kinase
MMESERSQLAKELHDELGGLITAAKMDMAWLQAHIGSSLDAASEEKFRSVVQMLNQAMMLKRRVVEALRPSLLITSVCRWRYAAISRALRAGRRRVHRHPAGRDHRPRAGRPAHAVPRCAGGAGQCARAWQARHVELVIELHADDGSDGYLLTIGDDGEAMDGSQQRSLAGMRHRVLGAGGGSKSTPSRARATVSGLTYAVVPGSRNQRTRLATAIREGSG